MLLPIVTSKYSYYLDHLIAFNNASNFRNSMCKVTKLSCKYWLLTVLAALEAHNLIFWGKNWHTAFSICRHVKCPYLGGIVPIFKTNAYFVIQFSSLFYTKCSSLNFSNLTIIIQTQNDLKMKSVPIS